MHICIHLYRLLLWAKAFSFSWVIIILLVFMVAVESPAETIHFCASKTMSSHDGITFFSSIIPMSCAQFEEAHLFAHMNRSCMSKTQLIKNMLLSLHFQFLFTATFATDIEPVRSFSARKWMSNAEVCKPHTAKLIDFPNGFAWNYEQYFIWIIPCIISHRPNPSCKNHLHWI